MVDSADLAGRLSLLERRLSRLRVITYLALLVGASGLAWGMWQGQDAVVEGRLWIAKDEAGRVRGMFGVSADGVGLTMYDATGQLRLDVGIAPGGVPGLLMLAKNGAPVATLNVPDGSPPTLRLVGTREGVRTELTPRAVEPLVTRPLAAGDTTPARPGGR